MVLNFQPSSFCLLNTCPVLCNAGNHSQPPQILSLSLIYVCIGGWEVFSALDFSSTFVTLPLPKSPCTLISSSTRWGVIKHESACLAGAKWVLSPVMPSYDSSPTDQRCLLPFPPCQDGCILRSRCCLEAQWCVPHQVLCPLQRVFSGLHGPFLASVRAGLEFWASSPRAQWAEFRVNRRWRETGRK